MSTRVVSGARIRRAPLLRTPLRRALLAAAAAVLAVGGVGAVGVGPAHAHDALLSSDPADGASVQRLPAAIELTFSRPVLAIGAGVTVVGPSGEVHEGKPELAEDVVRQPLSRTDAPAGRYTVRWRVTSSDGHPIDGTFAFTVRTGASSSPSSTPSSTPSPSTSAVGADTNDGSGQSSGTDGATDNRDSIWRTLVFPGIAGAVLGLVWVLYRRRAGKKA